MRGLEEAPGWLDLDSALAIFGVDHTSAGAGYERFVLAKLDSDESLWDQVQHGMFLGSDEWMIQMRSLVESKPRSTDHPKKQRAVGRPEMAKIMETVSGVASVPMDELRSRRSGTLRSLVAWLGWNEGLATLRQIAAALRLRSEGYVSSLIRRCEQRFSSSHELLRISDEALAALRC